MAPLQESLSGQYLPWKWLPSTHKFCTMSLSYAKEVPWWHIGKTCQICLDVPIEWHIWLTHPKNMYLDHSKEPMKGLVKRHLFGLLQRIPTWVIRRTLRFEKISDCWRVWSKDKARGVKTKGWDAKGTCWPSPMCWQDQAWCTRDKTPKLLHSSPTMLPYSLHQNGNKTLSLESNKYSISFLFEPFVVPPKASS